MRVDDRYGESNPNHALESEIMQLVQEVVKSTNVQPRPYQIRIVAKSLDMFMGRYTNGEGIPEPNARSVMIESPTGSGKTVMALLGARALQEELARKGQDLQVGWVAMRRNLLSQAAGENVAKGIGVRNFHPISMFDKNPVELIARKAEGKPVLLVVDEAQHDAASSSAHLHNTIAPDYVLGLSATPFRLDRVKLCFDKIIKDAGIHQLIKDGYLSQYHHYSIPDWTPEGVTATYLREPARWGKSAMYFVNLDLCYEACRLLKDAGIVAEVVTGETDVEDQLARFREGGIAVLVNCMKLTEGWDDPTLQTAFVRDSGKGPTMQMAGRAFRIHEKPGAGRVVKQIVQSKLTRWPIIRTAVPTQQFVWQQSSWLSLTVNPALNLINQNARVAIAQTQVDLPKYLLDKKAKKKKRQRR